MALNAPRPPFRKGDLETRIRQFVAAQRYGMHLLFEEQDRAALLHTATRLHQNIVRKGEQAQMAPERLERLAAWRVYGTSFDDVFRVNGKRVGN